MLVPRDLLEEIKIFLKRQEFMAIIGPRQAGKTILLEMLQGIIGEESVKARPRFYLLRSIIFKEDERINLHPKKNPFERPKKGKARL